MVSMMAFQAIGVGSSPITRSIITAGSSNGIGHEAFNLKMQGSTPAPVTIICMCTQVVKGNGLQNRYSQVQILSHAPLALVVKWYNN